MIGDTCGKREKITRIDPDHDRIQLACEGEDRRIRRLPTEFRDLQGTLCRVTEPFRYADQGFGTALVKQQVQRDAPSEAAGLGAD